MDHFVKFVKWMTGEGQASRLIQPSRPPFVYRGHGIGHDMRASVRPRLGHDISIDMCASVRPCLGHGIGHIMRASLRPCLGHGIRIQKRASCRQASIGDLGTSKASITLSPEAFGAKTWACPGRVEDTGHGHGRVPSRVKSPIGSNREINSHGLGTRACLDMFKPCEPHGPSTWPC
ncbi:hypothetical protein F383_17927 [Gossypium arboreum]|uniref:Uncharacterized protein n=1 Tax=Gossypium arboreum TaxID=29729 RepID=A0A0B0MCI1_GOSAR|nr:hypothetical protein F383_17927 [Gossypium arboreum]